MNGAITKAVEALKETQQMTTHDGAPPKNIVYRMRLKVAEALAALTSLQEQPASPGPYETRICKGMPADCCDYGVISLTTGKEVCRVWTEADARMIASALQPSPAREKATEIVGMKSIIVHLQQDHEFAVLRATAAEARVRELEAALEFYAAWGIENPKTDDAIHNDCGDIARTTIGRTK